LIKSEERDLPPYLDWCFDGKLRRELDGKTREEFAAWFVSNRDFLRADKRRKIVIDLDAQAFGNAPDSGEFFAEAIEQLQDSGQREQLSRKLLARYSPSGPGEDAPAIAWRAWLDENRDYLIYSDSGRFRRYVDSMAKKRVIPTAPLHSEAPASDCAARRPLFYEHGHFTS
jgi:hypothetical protein